MVVMLLRAPQSQSVMVVDDDSDDEDCVVTEVIPAASHPRSIAKEIVEISPLPAVMCVKTEQVVETTCAHHSESDDSDEDLPSMTFLKTGGTKYVKGTLLKQEATDQSLSPGPQSSTCTPQACDDTPDGQSSTPSSPGPSENDLIADYRRMVALLRNNSRTPARKTITRQEPSAERKAVSVGAFSHQVGTADVPAASQQLHTPSRQHSVASAQSQPAMARVSVVKQEPAPAPAPVKTRKSSLQARKTEVAHASAIDLNGRPLLSDSRCGQVSTVNRQVTSITSSASRQCPPSFLPPSTKPASSVMLSTSVTSAVPHVPGSIPHNPSSQQISECASAQGNLHPALQPINYAAVSNAVSVTVASLASVVRVAKSQSTPQAKSQSTPRVVQTRRGLLASPSKQNHSQPAQSVGQASPTCTIGDVSLRLQSQRVSLPLPSLNTSQKTPQTLLNIFNLPTVKGEEAQAQYAQEAQAMLNSGLSLDEEVCQRLLEWMCSLNVSHGLACLICKTLSHNLLVNASAVDSWEWWWKILERFLSDSRNSLCHESSPMILELSALALHHHIQCSSTTGSGKFPLCPLQHSSRINLVIDCHLVACKQSLPCQRGLSTLLDLACIQYGALRANVFHHCVQMVAYSLKSGYDSLTANEKLEFLCVLPDYLSFRIARILLEEKAWRGHGKVGPVNLSQPVDSLLAQYRLVFQPPLSALSQSEICSLLAIVVEKMMIAKCSVSMDARTWLHNLVSCSGPSRLKSVLAVLGLP